MKSPPCTRSKSLNLFILAIILTVTAGWFFTDFLGRVAEKEFREKADRDANLTAAFLKDNLDDVEHAAKALGLAEAIVAAFDSGHSTDQERANRLLDRIKGSMDMSVCYLLDRNGLAVASSNRKEKNGFVGQSFASRPYFTGALAGRLTTYFALGKVSRERGYFAAAPVVGSSGAITGVAVIKRDIAPVAELFRKYTDAFLVSPEGVIFVSSREEFLYRSLWPIAEKVRSELAASRQFGKINFEPLLAAEPRTGTYVRFENEKHYVVRLPFGSDGWSLAIIDDPHIVSSYRLFGILLTVVFVLLLLFFFSLLQNKNKSLEASKELLKARDDWKRTFDTVPDLIATIDSNHRIINMNRAMAERLGIPQNAAVGRRCCELVHGSQEPPPSCPHRRSFFSGRIEAESLFELNLKGDFMVTASPLLAADGTVESSVHVMHDVSELKQLERTLKEYAQRLEFVLAGSNDGTWECNLVTDQTILNKRYYEMLEYTPGEVNTDFAFFIKTIHPEDITDVQRRVHDNVNGTTKEYEAQYRMITKSGKLRHVMARGKVVSFDEDGRPLKVAGVVTDVTEIKRLGDEVNRIHNLESIGLLAGGLAHDFNNVLNVIYGNISFARMLVGGNTAIVEPLKEAEEACERAKELGIRLQAFAQGNSPAREPISLPAIIEQVAGTLFKGSNILHTVTVADDLFPVEADPRQIRQVFENLLTNAKEAMAEGGTVTVNIENYVVDRENILPIASGDYLRIAIKDSGKGIPEENLPKIFDPYFSTKDTYSQKGLGLGLSICHAILKRHNGHLAVESIAGIGTNVTVYLPASRGEAKLSATT